MSANTFPLRNQSLALESLKDQLGFLVTIILGGDSFTNKTKTPKPIEDRRDAALRSRGCDKIHKNPSLKPYKYPLKNQGRGGRKREKEVRKRLIKEL